MNRLIRTLFIAAIACFALGSCALVLGLMDTDVSHQPRFANVLARDLHTRRMLYLYQPEYGGSKKKRQSFELRDSADTGRENLVAVVPVGHPVRFTQVLRQHAIEETWDDMFGQLTLNGKVFPVVLSLGGSIYPDEWRRILVGCFGIRE